MKKTKIFKIICGTAYLVLFIFSQVGPLKAQIGSTGSTTDRYGSFYTYSTRPIGSLGVYMFNNLKFSSATADRSNGSILLSESINDIGYLMGIQFGIDDKIDIIAVGNFFQTANLASSVPRRLQTGTFSKSNSTLDLFFLNLKYSAYSFKENKIGLGFMITTKFAGSAFTNVPFREYSSGSTEVGVTLLSSYYSNPQDIDASLRINFNLGYWNSLDKGKYLGYIEKDTLVSLISKGSLSQNVLSNAVGSANTAGLNFGLGLVYPMIWNTRILDLEVDLYGRYYLTNPPLAAYSRQSHANLSVGAKYQALNWMFIHLGGEFQVWKQTSDLTFSSTDLGIEDLTISESDYPAWRVFTGLSFPLSPRPKERLSAALLKQLNREKKEIQKKGKIEGILYSEREIQKRRVNLDPVVKQRQQYKQSVRDFEKTLKAKGKLRFKLEQILPVFTKPAETEE